MNAGRLGAAGINGRVKFLPLAWARMPKTSYRKNSDSLVKIPVKHRAIIRHSGLPYLQFKIVRI